MRLPLLLPVSLIVLLSACDRADAVGGGTPTPQPSGDRRYATTGTVLESPEHGPELCWIVASSHPPLCGVVPVPNWDWDQVTGEESAAGTTWGTFHMVGTYDGDSFTVVEVSPPQPQAPPEPDVSSPCQPPGGGWPVPDPARTSIGHRDAAARLAESNPDFAAVWTTPLDPIDILNVAFTGNLDEHEAELRTAWGGPLCVTRHERTLGELQQIQKELLHERGAAEFGLQLLSSSADPINNVLSLRVVWADATARAEIDQRYGKGAVEITTALTPVE